MGQEHSSDPEWTDGVKKGERAASDLHIARLSAHWQREHRKRARKFERELRKDSPQASSAERLLLGIAAHDLALSDLLGRSEVELAQRTFALINDVALSLTLARSLRQVVACREAATRRVQDVLQCVGVLRGQRKLEEMPRFRRVA